MKKIRLILTAAAIATLALGACTAKNENARTTEDEVAATQESVPAGVIDLSGVEKDADGIYILENGLTIQPGMQCDRPVVIDFNAPWCGPCRRFAPVFEEAAKKFGDRIHFVSVNTDNVRDMMQNFGLPSGIPTVLIIRTDGTYTSRTGLGDIYPAEKFEKLIKDNTGI